MKEKDNNQDMTPFVEFAKEFIGGMGSQELRRLKKKDLTLNLVNLNRGHMDSTNILRYIRDSLDKDKKADKFFLLLAKTEDDLQKGKLAIQSLCTEDGFSGIDENGKILINPRAENLFACARYPFFRGRVTIVAPIFLGDIGKIEPQTVK